MIYNGRAADGLGYLDAAPVSIPFGRVGVTSLPGSPISRWNDTRRLSPRWKKSSRRPRKRPIGIFGPITTASCCSFPLTPSLEQSADAAKARERMKPYLAIAQDQEYTGLMAAGEFPFKHYSDLERVLVGLRKAGVPELSFGFDPKSPDRLDGAAIRSLLFGHEAQGRNSVRAKHIGG